MTNADPSYLFDSVHGLVTFEGDTGKLLFRLMNTAEVQRLRRIHQLGMSSLVFPGASHSRFAHSIGMLHVTQGFLARLRRVSDVTEDQEEVLLIAALLHDVGHGPHSHAFEKVAKDSHEKRTVDILTSAGTEVNDVLVSANPELPSRIASLFGGAPLADWSLPRHLRQVISSQLDADRFDYLLRDSHYTGVNYGTFDSRWLLEHLCVDAGKGLYVSRKARDALEAYVFARYHMYHGVYFHKATRAGEVMLRLLLTSYSGALASAETLERKKAVVPGAPEEVLAAFSGDMTLRDYLQLDDYMMSVFFRRCANCEHPLLRELGEGLLNRRLWKCRELTHVGARLTDLVLAVCSWLRGEGEPETLFQRDSPGDTPYKPYDPSLGPDEEEELIWIERLEGGLGELSQQCPTIRPLSEPYVIIRYYFPERLRDEIERFIDEWLKTNR